MKFKVTNWPGYEAGLGRRGNLSFWVTPEGISGWAAPRCKTRGGQLLYSDLAIETALALGMVLDMVALDLPVPDHTTLSRRARTWKP